MPAYYNEFDPYAAQWLRNLIAAGHIAPGDVDDRSIVEVKPNDLRDYDQCHFFAGIGGWSHALRLADWPDNRPVWTGSCPCQPFSAAGKQRGSEDERHLWPAFFDLIRECRPTVVFGEQVAGAAGYAWWDHVAADLEGEGYAAAAADIGAHSVGAPHLRQRLYWVAQSESRGIVSRRGSSACVCGSRLSAAESPQWERAGLIDLRHNVEHCGVCNRPLRDGELADSDRAGSLLCERDCEQIEPGQQAPRGNDADGCGEVRWMADANGRHASAEGRLFDSPGASPWRDLEWLACSDGKARPTQPGLFPLADGIPGRVGRLRAYGNAIVPQVAAVFVMANVAGNRPP